MSDVSTPPLELSRLRAALAIGRVGTWSWDLASNVAAWDPSLLALIGFSADAPRHGDMHELMELIHPEDRAYVLAAMDEHLAAASAYEVEFRSVDADGSTRWILCRAEVTRQADRTPREVRGVCVDITQKKRVETQLQRVIRTLKAARVATFLWDAVAATISWEDEACLAFPGVSGAAFECDIDFVLAAIDLRDRDRACAAFQEAAETGRTVRLTCIAHNDDSTAPTTWFEVVLVGAADTSDGSGTLAGAFVDITAHKQLERQLLAARNKLELALLAGEVGTQIWDLQAGTLESDGLLDKLFGCSGEELMRNGFKAFIAKVDPRHRGVVSEMYSRALRRADATQCTYRYCRPDGAWVWLSSRSITECNAHGKAVRVIAAVADVSELKRAEERLRTQSDVSTVLARNDAIEDAVRAALDLVCSCEGLEGGGFWRVDADSLGFETVALRLPDSEDAPQIAEVLHAACATGDLVFPRTRRWKRNGSWPRKSSSEAGASNAGGFVGRFAQPVFIDGECVGVLVFVGRTALLEDEDMQRFMEFVGVQLALFVRRRRAEHALVLLNGELEARVRARTSELEQSNKELEGFSYSISHDLRAPLRAVDGFSQALVTDFGELLPAEGKRLVGAIRDGAQRMGDLIDDLLDFSRLSRAPVRKRLFETGALVEECLSSLAHVQVGRTLTIKRGELPASLGDRALLKQVWVNLLSNALKYTAKCEHGEVIIGAEREAGLVVYSVRDNGAGFDMRYANKLFGVFRRLHRAEDYEGTGVGLAIAQRIVHRHGGRIWADAKIGQGATFYFTLGPAPGAD